MEIILAIVVASAVIFFGALISMGNERQRKAIDALHEQVALWAVKDLYIKRERLAREVRVDDPLAWLNKIVSKVYKTDLKLQVCQVFDEPSALICLSTNQGGTVVLSPLSPNDIRKLGDKRRSRISNYGDGNPMFSLGMNMETHEFSVLNGGIFFDLELQLAWKGLTGQTVESLERLWLYRAA